MQSIVASTCCTMTIWSQRARASMKMLNDKQIGMFGHSNGQTLGYCWGCGVRAGNRRCVGFKSLHAKYK